MFSKLFRKISKRNSLNDRPNRNENGILEFFDSYVTYLDVINHDNL